MATKRRKKKKKQANATTLSDQMYRHYLSVLIGALDGSSSHHAVYDLGPGQRPAVALRGLKRVAKKEGINVLLAISNNGQSIVMIFNEREREPKYELERVVDGSNK